jgi:hypothetical protein
MCVCINKIISIMHNVIEILEFLMNNNFNE